MAELYGNLLNEDVILGSFDCGNSDINKRIKESYFDVLTQMAYSYRVSFNGEIVAFYQISIRTISVEDCPESITDYMNGETKRIPSLYIDYIAVDKKFQKRGFGTYILEYIIQNVRNWAEFIPLRLVTLDAVAEKKEWYKNRGFQSMPYPLEGQEGYNEYMYLDCIKNPDKLESYCMDRTGY